MGGSSAAQYPVDRAGLVPVALSVLLATQKKGKIFDQPVYGRLDFVIDQISFSQNVLAFKVGGIAQLVEHVVRNDEPAL